MSEIKYPYIPEGRVIWYVGITDLHMAFAKYFARFHSLDSVMPGAAVIVQGNEVLGVGANGSEYHKTQKCRRVILGCKSGEGYELCEGCHPKNHSEAKAIRDAQEQGNNIRNADLYLWGWGLSSNAVFAIIFKFW
jgi:Cytidine and deoxycytidylate deaminase zinc-binding region.